MDSLTLTNRTVFQHFFERKDRPVMTQLEADDLLDLSGQITPQSFKAGFARRFRAVISQETYQRLMIDETKRLYQRFLKGWLRDVASRLITLRSDPTSPSSSASLSSIQQDPLVLQAELEQALTRTREMEVVSKKTAAATLRPASHLIACHKDDKERDIGVFKSLSGSQMAGELASYLLGLYCGIDVFHTVVPGYVWINEGTQNFRSTGIYSEFHDETFTAYELSCAKSEGFEALKRIPATTVQAICLMHMLRGSEDAHLGNTLIRLVKHPASGESVVTRIFEIDGEHIMSSSERDSARSPGKEIASMRIWWLGLPQAAAPLDEGLLQLILGWSSQKLSELHDTMKLYSRERVAAQIWRLEKMRNMAREALRYERPLSARDIFFELIHKHPTLGLLYKSSEDDIWIYNQVGRISRDEIPEDSSRTPSPRLKRDEMSKTPMLFLPEELLALEKTA
jgi:hypothetical protein